MMTLKSFCKVIFLPAVAALSCCTLMHDDLPDCPSGLDVRFVYDYNTERADMFHDQVGGVSVYIFDSDGALVEYRDESNSKESAPLKSHDYAMHFNLPEGNYHIVAFAQQNDYMKSLQSENSTKFRRTVIEKGDNISQLKVRLDRTETGHVDNGGKTLDTLWVGNSATTVTVKPYSLSTETISLVRDTKHLTIGLHQLDNGLETDIDDYEIEITDRNGIINYDNTLLPDEEIKYTPYAKWNSTFSDVDGNPLEVTARAALSFARIVYYPVSENEKNAVLSIRNVRTGVQVATINLPAMLGQGRGAFETRYYTLQEYLDREHDYHLDFFIKGDRWSYAELSIGILQWTKRIHNVDL